MLFIFPAGSLFFSPKNLNVGFIGRPIIGILTVPLRGAETKQPVRPNDFGPSSSLSEHNMRALQHPPKTAGGWGESWLKRPEPGRQPGSMKAAATGSTLPRSCAEQKWTLDLHNWNQPRHHHDGENAVEVYPNTCPSNCMKISRICRHRQLSCNIFVERRILLRIIQCECIELFCDRAGGHMGAD